MSGAHLPYIAAEFPETIPGHFREALGVHDGNRHFDTVLMGRHTYEVGLAIGVTSPYPHLRQYVISQAMTASPDPAITLVGADPVECVRQLILKINPIVLGDGIPLFERARGPRILERSTSPSASSRSRASPECCCVSPIP